MAFWTEQFENHPLWGSLTALEEQLDAASERASSDPDAYQELERYRQATSEARRRLKAADANLVSGAILNQMNKQAAPLTNAVSQFIASGSRTHLEQARPNLDGLLTYVAQIPVLMTKQDVEAVGEAVVSFRRAAGQHTRYLNEELEKVKGAAGELQQSIEQLSTMFDAQKARVDQFITQAQTQVTTVENQRTEAFQKSLSQFSEQFQQSLKQIDSAADTKVQQVVQNAEAQLKELRDQLNQLGKEAEAASKARQEEFVAAQQAWGTFHEESAKAFKELVSKAEDEAAQQRSSHDADAKSIVEQLTKLKNQAVDIVGVIANTGMSGGYQKVADAERGSARFWSVLTILCMTGFVGFAVYAFFQGTTDAGFAWGVFFAKVYASVAFGVFATYAGRQSAKHHDGERRARRLQLELASLDPYLESMPEQERHKIKQGLAERMFGRTDEVKPEAEIVSSKSAFDLLSDVVKTLAKR